MDSGTGPPPSSIPMLLIIVITPADVLVDGLAEGRTS